MSNLSSQQNHEVGFWKGLVEQHGKAYERFRYSEFGDKTCRFMPWFEVSFHGRGLDLGCGCVSVLGACSGIVFADALVDEYKKMHLLDDRYVQADAENLPWPDAYFDWVFCVNMLDHTPNPAKAVAEMHRVLKPGGRLFFEVNFDDDEAPAHYGKWTIENVEDLFFNPITGDGVVVMNCSEDSDWKLIMFTIERHDEGNQYRYWAVYEKR